MRLELEPAPAPTGGGAALAPTPRADARVRVHGRRFTRNSRAVFLVTCQTAPSGDEWESIRGSLMRALDEEG